VVFSKPPLELDIVNRVTGSPFFNIIGAQSEIQSTAMGLKRPQDAAAHQGIAKPAQTNWHRRSGCAVGLNAQLDAGQPR